MKITIDTREDNKGEIKKLINLLKALVDEPAYSNNNDVFEKEGTDSMGAFSSMFGSSNDLNDEEQSSEKKLKENIEIIPY